MFECAQVVFRHGIEKRLKVNLRRSTWIQTRAKGIAGFGMEQGPGGMATFFSRVALFCLFLCLSAAHQGVWVGGKGGGEDSPSLM